MSSQSPDDTTPKPAAEAQDEGYEPVMVDEAVVSGSAEDTELMEADVLEGPPGAPPPQRKAQMELPKLAEVSQLDREFISRVFVQVKDVDFRSPPPPPPKKDLAGPDKKIALLRQKVHELERDLARVGYIWGSLQAQYEQVEKIIAAKEGEREQATDRYRRVKEQAAGAAQRDRTEIDGHKHDKMVLELKRSQLETDLGKARTDIADLTARLQKSEQEKTALLADFRSKMEAAQTAFNQLRDQSTRALGDFEQRLKKRDEEYTQKSQDLDSANTVIADKTRALDETQATLRERERTLERTQESEKRLEGVVTEKDKTLATLADEMTRGRAQSDEYVGELKSSLKQKDEQIETLRTEVKSARAEFDQLGGQSEQRRVVLERTERDLEAAKQELTTTQGQLDAAQKEITLARDEARIAKTDAEALGKRVAELESKPPEPVAS